MTTMKLHVHFTLELTGHGEVHLRSGGWSLLREAGDPPLHQAPPANEIVQRIALAVETRYPGGDGGGGSQPPPHVVDLGSLGPIHIPAGERPPPGTHALNAALPQHENTFRLLCDQMQINTVDQQRLRAYPLSRVCDVLRWTRGKTGVRDPAALAIRTLQNNPG